MTFERPEAEGHRTNGAPIPARVLLTPGQRWAAYLVGGALGALASAALLYAMLA